jgi:hypothetical protein
VLAFGTPTTEERSRGPATARGRVTYVVQAEERLAWTALALLFAVALLGTGMFVRWLGSRRVRRVSRSGAGPPAESRLPVLVVLGHGLLGGTTVLLVLTAALRG